MNYVHLYDINLSYKIDPLGIEWYEKSRDRLKKKKKKLFILTDFIIA